MTRMKKRLVIGIFLISIFIALNTEAQSRVPYPETEGFVTDTISLLKENEKKDLENFLDSFEKETGNEIALLIINSTKPETIEQYSIHVADKWKIGKKKLDNGILFIIALEDREMRIEVGRGLEGVLTDGTAVKILNTNVRPYFREEKFYEGIKSGIDTIAQIAKGEFDIKKLEEPARENPVEDLFTILLFVVPFILSFFAGYFAKTKSIFAGGITGGITGGIAAGVAQIGILYIIFGMIGGSVIGILIDTLVSGGKKGPRSWGGGGFFGGGGSGGGRFLGGGGNDSGSGGSFGGFGGGSFSGGGGSGRW